MAISLEGIKRRTDCYQVDPTQIIVQEGHNPREDFGDMPALTASIVENGVKVPLRVKRGPEGTIALIDGERRLRATLAAIEAGHDIQAVPCIFERNGISDLEALTLALITNDGKRLNPIEEAKGFKRMANYGCSPRDIAQKVGKSEVHVRNRLALIDAAPSVTAAVQAMEITVTTANQIIRQSGGSIEAQNEALNTALEPGTPKRKKRTALEVAVDRLELLTLDELASLAGEIKARLEGAGE